MTHTENFLHSLYFWTPNSVVDDKTLSRLNQFSKRKDITYLDAEVGRGLVKSVRNCSIYNVSANNEIDEEHKWFDSAMYQILSQCMEKYREAFPLFNYTVDSGYDILKYQKGGKYVFHADSSPNKPRVLSFLFYLNSDYTGGEFQMFEDGEPQKMEAGSISIFPSTDYYIHRVLPVQSGERRCVVTWLELRVENDA